MVSKPLREVFGKELIRLGNQYSNLVVLDADISSSLKTGGFAEAYPDRHINFGVAEQNMLMSAAGLATTGLIPLACTYATFASMRACEQIRSMIAYPKLNVKVIATHGGIEVGWDGPTHQATEDLAMMRSIPNMTVVVPADANAVPSLLEQAINLEGPVFFRMGRNPVPIIYEKDEAFLLGNGKVLRKGERVVLVACGTMVGTALFAAQQLEKDGIACSVIDFHTIKPFDHEILIQTAKNADLIVSMEDHNIIGGLGGAVAESLSEHIPRKLLRIGVRDTFTESGDPKLLYQKYNMDKDTVVEKIKKTINKEG